jgi:hypothetical protein
VVSPSPPHQAVRRHAPVCLPLLRPHCHSRLPQCAVNVHGAAAGYSSAADQGLTYVRGAAAPLPAGQFLRDFVARGRIFLLKFAGLHPSVESDSFLRRQANCVHRVKWSRLPSLSPNSSQVGNAVEGTWAVTSIYAMPAGRKGSTFYLPCRDCLILLTSLQNLSCIHRHGEPFAGRAPRGGRRAKRSSVWAPPIQWMRKTKWALRHQCLQSLLSQRASA